MASLAERKALADQLASEYGISETTAAASVEERARVASEVARQLATSTSSSPSTVEAAAPSALPNALECRSEIIARLGQQIAFFLDYDGTLTPIVEDPSAAVLDNNAGCRDVLRRLSAVRSVAVVSGRSCDKLRAFLQLDGLHLAGSHGLDIRGPEALSMLHPQVEAARGTLETAARALDTKLAALPGYQTEDNVFCISAHYRMVAAADRELVHAAVREVLAAHPGLTHKTGKMVHELRPAVEWDKGKAVAWLRDALGGAAVAPIYIGDDVADEDALAYVESAGGVGIKVSAEANPTTAASYVLRDPSEVRDFLAAFVPQ